jgi:hypothetical protein
MPSIKMPTPRKRQTSDFYWIRKKVPTRYRPLVGKKEVWRSLETKDLRTATARSAVASATLEAEWAQLAATGDPPPGFEPIRLSHQDLLGLQRLTHERIRDRLKADPPTGFRALVRVDGERMGGDPLDEAADILHAEGFDVTDDSVARFVPLLARAKIGAIADLKRAAAGDYSEDATLAKLPTLTRPALDFVKAFEEYAAKGGLKGGAHGPTAKGWRPKIKAFVKWLDHRDLARMTTADGYRWVDQLVEEDYARKAVRDVWIASLSATAGFMVERRKLAQNPFRGIKVREVVDSNEETAAQPRQKGFTLAEATKILTATVATPSHLISVEMRAARRWLPWLCC